MRFKGLDLNLLVALDTLLEERSVSRAAGLLNLTQPALSAALSRLRNHFGDELLVQSGRQMIATAMGEELRPLVRQFIRQAALFLPKASGFDPQTSRRRFRIGTSDYIITVLISPLLHHLRTAAPGIGIDVFPTGRDIVERMDRGEVDLVIGPELFLSPSAPRQLLFNERHLVVGWSGNPAIAAPPSLDGFFELGHVAVRIGAQRELSFAERHLEAFGERRRIEITTTQFTSVPWMVIGTDRVGVLQERLAQAFAALLPIVMQPLPFDMPMLNELVQHHPSRSGDAGIAWLIDALKATAERTGP